MRQLQERKLAALVMGISTHMPTVGVHIHVMLACGKLCLFDLLHAECVTVRTSELHQVGMQSTAS